MAGLTHFWTRMGDIPPPAAGAGWVPAAFPERGGGGLRLAKLNALVLAQAPSFYASEIGTGAFDLFQRHGCGRLLAAPKDYPPVNVTSGDYALMNAHGEIFLDETRRKRDAAYNHSAAGQRTKAKFKDKGPRHRCTEGACSASFFSPAHLALHQATVHYHLKSPCPLCGFELSVRGEAGSAAAASRLAAHQGAATCALLSKCACALRQLVLVPHARVSPLLALAYPRAHPRAHSRAHPRSRHTQSWTSCSAPTTRRACRCRRWTACRAGSSSPP